MISTQSLRDCSFWKDSRPRSTATPKAAHQCVPHLEVGGGQERGEYWRILGSRKTIVRLYLHTTPALLFLCLGIRLLSCILLH